MAVRARGEESKETTRVEAFSDGVFAFAVTLLVLDLTVAPFSSADSPADLLERLRDEMPAYLSFVLSFVTIFVIWVNHHALFRRLSHIDGPLLYANGLFLLVVATSPLPTKIMGEYFGHEAERVAAAIYAGYFVLVSLAFNVIWFFVVRGAQRGEQDIELRDVRAATVRSRLGLLAYVVAAVVAFWSAWLTVAICVLLWVFWFWAGIRHHVHEHEKPTAA